MSTAPPPSIGARRPELAGLDAVFATAMAKDPSQRFGSCTQFAEQLGQQLSPSFAYAGEIPFRADTQDTQPSFERRRTHGGAAAEATRRGVLVGALAGTALLIAGGVVRGRQAPRPPQAGPRRGAARRPARPPKLLKLAPNTGPFTGVYTVDFGPVTGVEGHSAHGCDADQRNLGCSLGVRPRRVHGDRVTAERRHHAGHDDGVRPGRR